MHFSSRPWVRRSLVSFWMLAVVASTALLAGSIQVTCLSADSRPIKGVQVTLQSLPSGTTTVKKSNKAGIVKFEANPGIYRVWGNKDELAPAYFEFIDLEGVDSTAQVTLIFESGDPTALLPFQNPAIAQRSNELLVAGIQAAQAGDNETALEKVKEAYKVNPSNVDAPYNLAILYLQAGKLDEAEEALTEAHKLLSVFTKIYANDPAASPLRERLANVDKLLTSMPVQRLGREADAALQARDYETAIAKYSEMVEMEPENAVIHYNLALSLTHANRLDEAKKEIARALELKPGDLGFERLQKQILDIEKQGISLRASEAIKETQELLEKKEHQAALEKIQSVLDDVPLELQSGSWLLIARAYSGLGNSEEAIAAYRKSARLDSEQKARQAEAAAQGEGEAPPANAKAGIDRELANYFFEQGRFKEGIETYVQALKKENAPLTAELNKLGQTFSRQGKNDATALVYEKILELDPNYSEAYYQLGMYHFYDTEQRDKAKQLLEKYISLGGDKGKIDNAKAVLAVMSSRKR